MAIVKKIDEQTGTEVSINYEVIGQGDEVIIFHHGNGNCIEDWHTLGFVEKLKNDYKLILIDSRGYGKSSKLYDPAEYNLRSRADDTIMVLDKEKIEQAHCLGASVGASMCFILSRFYPERFKSYIFATPFFVLFDEEVKNSLKNGIKAYVAKLEKLIGCPISNELIKATFLSNDAQALLAANSSEWFNYNDYLKYIKVPSLIYVGSKEDSVLELANVSQNLSHSSGHGCRLHIFPNMKHAQVYWAGKEAAPVVHKFINDNFYAAS